VPSPRIRLWMLMAVVGAVGIALGLYTHKTNKITHKSIYLPPDIEGEVSKVDPLSQFVELNVGSDDGLVKGHVLYLSRTKPLKKLVGKVRIISTDPDNSVGQVVAANTTTAVKVQKGDRVSFHAPNLAE
jgi:hypothetical protein